MPVHLVSRADIKHAIMRLERDGEVVGSVITEGDDHLLVFTTVDRVIEYRTGGFISRDAAPVFGEGGLFTLDEVRSIEGRPVPPPPGPRLPNPGARDESGKPPTPDGAA